MDEIMNYDKAVEWYTKAVEAGNDRSMDYLGMIYEYHIRDTEKAIEWYTKAAKAGSSLAKEKLEKLK